MQRITLNQINRGIEKGEFQLYQHKGRNSRTVVLPERGRADLEKLKPDLDRVFGEEKEKPFGSHEKSKDLIHENRWLITLNNFIKAAWEEFNLNLKTHSFRINYITSLLRSTPLYDVSQIIGGSDMRTTVRYNRFIPEKESIRRKLNQLP